MQPFAYEAKPNWKFRNQPFDSIIGERAKSKKTS